MARKFFYIAAGMFLLALSYHLGATTASAQAPGGAVAAAYVIPDNTTLNNVVITSSGDVYAAPRGMATWVHVSNIFSGSPVPAVRESWGQVKARYRSPAGGSVTPGAQDR